MSSEEVKAALLDSFWGTGRGLTASSETRAEINELITQLEAVTPTPNPTEAMDMLDGVWKLVYTSNSELMALLALGKLPLITIEDITQTVQAYGSTVTNSLTITAPFSRTAFSTTASIEVRSPKRLQLRFERGTISTPELITDLELPDTVSVMGQTVDLSAAKSALAPVRSAGQGVAEQIASIVRQQPDLNIPIANERAQTWLLTTYLDDTLRINRGDGGSVFVLVKEATSAAAAAPTTGAPAATVTTAPAYVPSDSATYQMTDAAELADAPSVAGAEAEDGGEEADGPQGGTFEAKFEPLGVDFKADVSLEDGTAEVSLGDAKAEVSFDGGKPESGSKKRSEQGSSQGAEPVMEASVEPLGFGMKASVKGDDDAAAAGEGADDSSSSKPDEDTVMEASVEPLGVDFKASVKGQDEGEAGDGKGKGKGKGKGSSR